MSLWRLIELSGAIWELPMRIDYEAITAWGGLIAAVAAAVALLIESRRWRFSVGLDTLMNLRAQFHGEAMRRARSAAAKSIADRTYSNAYEILNFFEMIGLLTRLGALNDHMVWHAFFYWIDGYCQAAEEDIAKCNNKDPAFLSDLKFVHAKVLQIERRERLRVGAPPERIADIETFLREEAQAVG